MAFTLKTKVRFICAYVMMDVIDTGFESRKIGCKWPRLASNGGIL
jgi:hypothetical protein